MKISSPRNIFDLFYLDILENSMENILSLNCGEKCRSLTSSFNMTFSLSNLLLVDAWFNICVPKKEEEKNVMGFVWFS